MDMIEHRVRERAYFIWEAEGRVAGRAESHWIQAEIELAASSDEAVAAKPAKVPRAKAAAPKAPKAAAAKGPARAKKAPRAAETGIALH